eukprot:CAMPEP_0202965098 /NCGR_PEP_ID=MMETSP1396-20130829/9194_1 /ASSEMBLY_ACC=CAM_ASM_000872 /TAXON_ID= /ORGANISM="Pseudokeronopsis sp., Strain Brazil" /LENGTH=163 /DNA_ID=CAMNT_0049687713 /DNA_START=73 /DNA_END=564 /DNA_ORIENTATION=+
MKRDLQAISMIRRNGTINDTSITGLKLFNPNDLLGLSSLKQMDQIDFEIDSPLFEKAAKKLGIEIKDLEKKDLDDFKEKGVDDKVCEMRFKHHRSRLFQMYNEILAERHKLKKESQKDKHSKSQAQLSLTQTGIKGSFCHIPLSITKNKFSPKDFSMITSIQN